MNFLIDVNLPRKFSFFNSDEFVANIDPRTVDGFKANIEAIFLTLRLEKSLLLSYNLRPCFLSSDFFLSCFKAACTSSDARRVGKACDSKCRSRRGRDHQSQKSVSIAIVLQK